MHRFKNFLTKYPKQILTIGIILLVIAGAFGIGLFNDLKSNDSGFFAEGTPSQQATDKIEREFGVSSMSAVVLFEAKDDGLTIKDPAFIQEFNRLMKPFKNEEVADFYSTGSEKFVSKDKTATYSLISFEKGTDKENYNRLLEAFDDTDSEVLKVSLGGSLVANEQTQEQSKIDLTRAELISLPILAVLLLLFFRSPIATIIPLFMSVLTIAGALAVARLVNNFLIIDTYTINVITLLSVGLSVDYSLLIINRFREELRKNNVEEAVKITVSTAGRTILFSGLTVAICLLSLLIFPVEFMRSVSIGGASAVIVAMLISKLLIPPSLCLIGHKINLKKTNKKPAKETTVWHRVVTAVTRRPIASIVAGLILIGAFVWPVSQFETINFNWRALADNRSASYVGEKIESDFDAKADSLTVLVHFKETPTVQQLCETSETITKLDNVKEVAGAYAPLKQVNCQQMAMMEQMQMLPPALIKTSESFHKNNLARINITLDSKDNSPETKVLINELRDMKLGDQPVEVTGMATLTHDTQDVYAQKWPYVVIIIALAMVLLLGSLLGSIVLPLQAIVVNSLALLISLGVLVMLFQFGWLTNIFHHTPMLGLEPSIPILICVIAFGLSMDYSVFLYSRMHEVYEKTKDPNKAIVDGVVKTGPIITAAALVLFVVVASFATSHISVIQQIGIGLSVAVLIDAFFVRMILVPAIMKLFGKVSWYSPKWLKKIAVRHD